MCIYICVPVYMDYVPNFFAVFQVPIRCQSQPIGCGRNRMGHCLFVSDGPIQLSPADHDVLTERKEGPEKDNGEWIGKSSMVRFVEFRIDDLLGGNSSCASLLFHVSTLSLSLFCEFILKQSTVYSLFRGEATEHDLFMAGNQGG